MPNAAYEKIGPIFREIDPWCFVAYFTVTYAQYKAALAHDQNLGALEPLIVSLSE